MVSRPLESPTLAREPSITRTLSKDQGGPSSVDEPEIGDVDEGVVERGEDTGNAEDELA